MGTNLDLEAARHSSSSLKQERTACDLCKRMKIKCQKQGQSCEQCDDRGVACKTTATERKKRHPKRVNKITAIENRIQRLESALCASREEVQIAKNSVQERDRSAPTSDISDLSDRLSTLLIDEEGSSRFVGSSSGLSLFSPRGLQWIAEITGSNEIPQIFVQAAKECRTHVLEEEIDFCRPVSVSTRAPLPPKDEADRLVKFYFDNFNSMLPLYDKSVFDEHYGLQYTSNPLESVSWYASLNVVLAIGSVSEAAAEPALSHNLKNDPKTFLEHQGYRKYFRNAAGCFIDLMLKDHSLMGVQALCGLCILQQMNVDTNPFGLLISTAARVAFNIGIHRGLDESGLSKAEINQRRNVFWILYFMDKTLSLCLGHPSVINDDDIGVDLPQEWESIQYYPNGARKFDMFRYHVQMALFESRIYTELYSATGLKKSKLERLKSVGRLDKELQEWRLSIPVEIRPSEPMKCSPEQYPPVRVLHFGYFNCLTTIHRVCILHTTSWAIDPPDQIGLSLENSQLNPRVYASQSICLAAARSSIDLLRCPAYRDNFHLFETYYPLASFLVVFANVLCNASRNTPVAKDLELLDFVIDTLSPILLSVSPITVAPKIAIFHDLRDAAKRFVANNACQTTRRKRSYDDQDPLLGNDTPLSAAIVISTSGDVTANSTAASLMPHVNEVSSLGNVKQDNIECESVKATEKASSEEVDFLNTEFDMFPPHEDFEWDLAYLWNLDLTANTSL